VGFEQELLLVDSGDAWARYAPVASSDPIAQLRFTITKVATDQGNIGLAELEVY